MRNNYFGKYRLHSGLHFIRSIVFQVIFASGGERIQHVSTWRRVGKKRNGQAEFQDVLPDVVLLQHTHIRLHQLSSDVFYDYQARRLPIFPLNGVAAKYRKITYKSFPHQTPGSKNKVFR